MSRLALAVVVATASMSAVVMHHHKKTPASSATSVAPAGTVLSLVREPVPPRRRAPVRASRRHPRRPLEGALSDVTMYCSTGQRNAAGRWPRIGDVAVLDRSIAFGTRLFIAGRRYIVEDWIGSGSQFDIFGGADDGCEARALTFGRQHLRVEVGR